MHANTTEIDQETLKRIESARSLSADPVLDISYLPANIGSLLQSRAFSNPTQNFLTSYTDTRINSSYTNAEFYQSVLHIAAFLQTELELSTGDRIATLLSNSSDTVLLYFAAWILGLTVVPINRSENDERVAFILQNSESKALFALECEKVRCCSAYERFPSIHIILTSNVSRHPLPHDWFVFTDEIAKVTPLGSLPVVMAESECLIVYTSGTTGAPKGVILEQRNLMADALSIANWNEFGAKDIALCVLPIHHVNGIVVTLLTPLISGGSVVLADKFHAGSFWNTLSIEDCTWVSVVPTVLAMLCEKFDAKNMPPLPHLRHILCGAGPLTVEVARRFYDRFHIPIIHGYGLSETTCYSSFIPNNLSEAAYKYWMFECGFPSIGCPLSVNKMTIHDNDGRSLPEGIRGEIVVRGSNVMQGYFKRPDANRDAFKHSWFRTGDEGFFQLDENGKQYFFITGRIKELIIRGGVNYSPFDIDEVLNAIPGVASALAVGFEHSIYGEEIGAYVLKAQESSVDEKFILKECSAKLPFAKCPKVVVFGESLPVTSTGKYQRGKLIPYFSQWKNTHFTKA